MPILSEVTGIVTDQTGDPVDDARVELYGVDGSGRGVGGQTVRDGRYRIRNVPPGTYIAGVNVGSGGRERPPSIDNPYAEALARTEGGDTEFVLPLGGSVTLAPLTVRRMTLLTVRGLVRTSEGLPVAGLDLQAVMLDAAGHPLPARATRTDDRGRFDLQLWQGYRYRILAGSPGEREFVAMDETPLTITVPTP